MIIIVINLNDAAQHIVRVSISLKLPTSNEKRFSSKNLL